MRGFEALRVHRKFRSGIKKCRFLTRLWAAHNGSHKRCERELPEITVNNGYLIIISFQSKTFQVTCLEHRPLSADALCERSISLWLARTASHHLQSSRISRVQQERFVCSTKRYVCKNQILPAQATETKVAKFRIRSSEPIDSQQRKRLLMI